MKKAILYSLTAWSLSLAIVACGSNGGGGGGGSVDNTPAPTAPVDGLDRSLQDMEPSVAQSQPTDPAQTQTQATPDSKLSVPNPLTPEQIKKMENQALRFAGSSNDYLRIKAAADLALVSDENQRLKNLVLANSIQSGRIKIDYNNTGELDMSLKIGESSKTAKTYDFGGQIENGQATLLSKQGRGTLKCMDVGTTCENLVVDLRINGADAKIIFRRTNVDWAAKFPPVNCATQECENFYTLARQSEVGTYDKNTTRTAKLETMEVINGRSTFKFILITKADQIVTIGGELLSPVKYPLTNLPADLRQDADDLLDLQNDANYRTNMQQSLSDVRIVSNDGLGKIEMLVNFPKQNNGAQDNFALTVTRINKPIRSR
jgi:hypothetical protein